MIRCKIKFKYFLISTLDRVSWTTSFLIYINVIATQTQAVIIYSICFFYSNQIWKKIEKRNNYHFTELKFIFLECIFVIIFKGLSIV